MGKIHPFGLGWDGCGRSSPQQGMHPAAAAPRCLGAGSRDLTPESQYARNRDNTECAGFADRNRKRTSPEPSRPLGDFEGAADQRWGHTNSMVRGNRQVGVNLRPNAAGKRPDVSNISTDLTQTGAHRIHRG